MIFSLSSAIAGWVLINLQRYGFFRLWRLSRPKKWQKPPFQWLLCPKSGDGRNRTLVQTRNSQTFYMLILLLVFEPSKGVNALNETLSHKLHFAVGDCSKLILETLFCQATFPNLRKYFPNTWWCFGFCCNFATWNADRLLHGLTAFSFKNV